MTILMIKCESKMLSRLPTRCRRYIQIIFFVCFVVKKRGVNILKYRVGVVPYFNNKPLIWGISNYKDIFDVIEQPPAILAEMMNNNELNIAMLPTYEYINQYPKYKIIPDISISSRNLVRSTLVLSDKEITDIKTVLLDKNSLSSNNLTKIIFKNVFHKEPIYIEKEDENTTADTFVVIGDKALQISDSYLTNIDLAEQWHNLTNLPFVFALWCMNKNVNSDEIIPIFHKMKKDGLSNRDVIAKIESEKLKISLDICKEYIYKNITFDLRGDEINAITKYSNYLYSLGLINHANYQENLNNFTT